MTQRLSWLDLKNVKFWDITSFDVAMKDFSDVDEGKAFGWYVDIAWIIGPETYELGARILSENIG